MPFKIITTSGKPKPLIASRVNEPVLGQQDSIILGPFWRYMPMPNTWIIVLNY